MLSDIFHSAVSQWFSQQFNQATDIQMRAWPAIQEGSHTLIAAPTGSGKTFAAFLASIDQLVRESLSDTLKNETRILYVSPLKALSNDIRKNLDNPLQGIREQLLENGLADIKINAAVRTGDTTQSERNKIRRNPPHILVTTPESLYILLTSASGRKTLATVSTVIIDEIHALAGNKRGAHLSLSLERLAALCDKPPVRIGLSATQKPIEDMALFLIGNTDEECTIINSGHKRERDLSITTTASPLEAVMANEVWREIYDNLIEQIQNHNTTLIFVNTRRLSERVAKALSERLNDEEITAHHGSLSKEHRLQAEQALKQGKLKALVATASLELGIDIGDIDLVCQIGSPRSISGFLQRVGRSGHSIGKTPKGRLYPLSRDDLFECVALLDAVDLEELDTIKIPDAPLDVLAQQIVAEVSIQEWEERALYEKFVQARPYQDLNYVQYTDVLRMLADGFALKRGRRGSYLHWDRVNHKLRGRRGANLVAITNGGAIPEQFDYQVVLQPAGLKIGTLNEDFAFESLPGDIFQLGNTSYRMLKIEKGKVFVEDAKGQPPNLPFWLGEAPGRSAELSLAVSRLRQLLNDRLDHGIEKTTAWLIQAYPVSLATARQVSEYLGTVKATFAQLPSQSNIIIERFFDENGDMHVVIHSPYGSRINRAWGLALRKRFCRKFNFELQAAALDDTIILSLSASHSFELSDIIQYVKAATVRGVLMQALLDAPMFPTRWRWVANTSLAIPRMRNGKKVPAPFQRNDAEDLIALIFPDQLACQENLSGNREIPDHPLISQTINDCLHDLMDIDGLENLLTQIENNEVKVTCKDLTCPSALAQEILNARPYAFLDDTPAEERRTLAVQQRRFMDPQTAGDLGQLSQAAIDRVKAEAWPLIQNSDELHDALNIFSFLSNAEINDEIHSQTSIENSDNNTANSTKSSPSENTVENTEESTNKVDAEVNTAHTNTGNAKETLNAPNKKQDNKPRHDNAADDNKPDPNKQSNAASPKQIKPEIKQAIKKDLKEKVTTEFEALTVTVANKTETAGNHLCQTLLAEKRALCLQNADGTAFWIARERMQEFISLYQLPESDLPFKPLGITDQLEADIAIREILRGRLELLGPVTETALNHALGLAPQKINNALLALEQEGFVMRGQFTPHSTETEWCERGLLARIHRYTLKQLRAEIEPVSPAEFMRFLFHWHRIDDPMEGQDSLKQILTTLEGSQIAAAAWEKDILAARIKNYAPNMLDNLCTSGRYVWMRMPTKPGKQTIKSSPINSTPISLLPRTALSSWQSLSAVNNDRISLNAKLDTDNITESIKTLSANASTIQQCLQQHGASFFSDLVDTSGLIANQCETALGELVTNGIVTSDSFAGLRYLIAPEKKKQPRTRSGRRKNWVDKIEEAGRWSICIKANPNKQQSQQQPQKQTRQQQSDIEYIARALLARYGIVFRKLLEKESNCPPWRDLLYTYRTLEARGEIRGGRFVNGFSGEQFALPDAIGTLRKIRRDKDTQQLCSISAADPLNLTGIITNGTRVPSVAGNRVLYRDGIPVAISVAGQISFIEKPDSMDEWEIRNALLKHQKQVSYYSQFTNRPV